MSFPKKRNIDESFSCSESDASYSGGSDTEEIDCSIQESDAERNEEQDIENSNTDEMEQQSDDSQTESSTPLSARLKNFQENLKWRANSTFQPIIHDFSDPKVGIQPNVNLNIDSTPLDVLQQFYTDEMFEMICFQTNSYAEKKQNLRRNANQLKANSRLLDYHPTDPDEMLTFYSLILLMGIIKKPTLEMYWSNDKLLETPFFLMQ